MAEIVKIKEFAERVERLCDFFIAQSERFGSDDLKVIQDLKEDAANIQFDKVEIVTEALDGLSEFMKGATLP